MLIDAHTHVFPPTMQNHRHELILRDKSFRLLYQNEKAKLVGAEEVITMLDDRSIDRAVIFGFPWQDLELCRQGNNYVLESITRFPDRLIGFITLPWQGTDEVIQECERGIKFGARGVGELAQYHQPQNQDIFQSIGPIAKFLEEKKLPLLLHVNEPVGHNYPGKIDIEFKTLQTFISVHQELTLILAHWGGGFFFYELMPEIKKITSNVFYDTAASPLLYHHQIYEIALKIIGEERILFGSDFPLLTPRKYFKEMNVTINSEEALKKIKGENAQRILNL
ncbi:MAG: amidohydrolase family protein [Desulfobacterota bacterium]|nr:amidohydrolase family protein [Thermodesulfobacteriota bacterium]